MSEFIDRYRSAFSADDMARFGGMKVPEDVEIYADLSYGEDPEYQILDVYRPKDRAGESLPVIVSVHGGGWVFGNKEIYKFYCTSLAQRGFAVVNYSYRLAPEAKFPAAIEDTNSVVAWILENKDTYGLDNKRMFAVGDSAGAQILALYAMICADRSYAANFPFKPAKKRPFRALGLNCGAYLIKDEPALTPIMQEYLPGGGTEEELALNHVPDHITEEFPPCFIMSAMGDFKRMDAIPLAARCSEVGVPFVLRQYGTPDDPLYHVFHLDPTEEAAIRCNDEECAFFKSYC